MQAAVWEGNGIVSLVWPPEGQQGLVGCNLLATQSFLFMQGLRAVKDMGLCMYAGSYPFGS